MNSEVDSCHLTANSSHANADSCHLNANSCHANADSCHLNANSSHANAIQERKMATRLDEAGTYSRTLETKLAFATKEMERAKEKHRKTTAAALQAAEFYFGNTVHIW